MRLFKNGSVVAASSKGAFSYTKGQRKSVSFNVALHNYWTFNGLEIRFEIVNTSYSILKAYATTFNPPTEETVTGYLLKQNLYISNSVGFYGDGSGLKELKDVFDFTGISEYFDEDYYYRLDIGKVFFYYYGANDLPYRSIDLRFNDDELLFPNLHHDANGDIVLPLGLNRNGIKNTFKYRNQFYVNRKTLDISDTYKTGYISTSNFYLPINGLNKFNGKTVYFDISGIGVSGLTTSIPLKYDVNRAYISLCSDGDYCVVGGV